MMMMYKGILFAAIILAVLIGTCSATPLNITSTHGETWIIWNWTIPTEYIDSGADLVVKVDGVSVHDMLIDSNVTILTNYYLTGIHSNEPHVLRVEISNSTYIFEDDISIVTTSQSSTFNYVIFVIGIGMLFVAIFMREKIISVVISTVSIVIFLFLSVVLTVENPSLSLINIVFSVVTGFIILYMLYIMFSNWTTWDKE